MLTSFCRANAKDGLKLETYFILEQTHVRNYRYSITEAVADHLGNDDPSNLLTFADSLLYPSHVTHQLANRVIGAAGTLQLETNKGARVVDRQNIYRPDVRWILSSIPASVVNIQMHRPPFHRNRAQVLREKV